MTLGPVRLSERAWNLALRSAVLLYVGAVVAFPVGTVVHRAVADGPGALREALADEEAVAAFRLSFESAAVVAAANALLGTVAAYALVRCRFPGRRFLEAVVDLPLALPTAVTGLTLALLLGPQSPVGAFLEARGLPVLYEPVAVYVACAAVSLPFVIRAVEPLLLAVDAAEEEASATLGAGPVRTFVSVVLPAIRPGILSGAALSFARSLGEFGAVVFVAGTEPFRTEVASTLVYARIESFDLRGASAASVVVLSISFVLLWSVRTLERSVRGATA